MADTKISALPAATLPLAGIEVLPIVQGGTTDQVSVANLTAGRTQTSNGIVQGTAGTGYNFTANTFAAGMTSRLLNAYEEGTFTPTITAGSGTITTVGTVVGRYTRVGRTVTVNLSIAITTNGTGASSIIASTVPISASTALAVYSGSGYNSSTGRGLSVATQSSDNKIYIRNADATYPVADGQILFVTVTYLV